jgi:hypothetical protein
MGHPTGRTHHALHDACVLLDGWDSVSRREDCHQLLLHLVVTDIDEIIFLPDGSCCLGVTFRKSVHSGLKHPMSLLTKIQNSCDHGGFGDCSV